MVLERPGVLEAAQKKEVDVKITVIGSTRKYSPSQRSPKAADSIAETCCRCCRAARVEQG